VIDCCASHEQIDFAGLFLRALSTMAEASGHNDSVRAARGARHSLAGSRRATVAPGTVWDEAILDQHLLLILSTL
jgi:hypothetical protein